MLPAASRSRASRLVSSTCTRSIPSTGRRSSPRPTRRAPFSPSRSTTSPAGWARQSRKHSRRQASASRSVGMACPTSTLCSGRRLLSTTAIGSTQRASSRSHAISSEKGGSDTMSDIASQEKVRALDVDLRRRAAAVIPGGMFGHMNVTRLPDAYPQFWDRSEGTRVWDVDGNEYVDFMCSFGPMILGYKHPRVQAAAAAQAEKGDTQPGPAPCMVKLAELLVERVAHADWAIFAKNGSDATTISLM